MKMVFLAYLQGYGGAEKQIIMLANNMIQKGHDVSIISIAANNVCYSISKNIRYYYLPDRKSGILRFFTRYNDLKRLLLEIKPDITVSFWYQSAYFTALMSKRVTGSVIYAERGDPYDDEYAGLLGMVRTFTLPRIDGFVFQSKGAKKYFNERIQSRSTVIPNPVYIKRSDFPNVVERRKSIVTIGRLHPQKNQNLLIDAFFKIKDYFPDYTLDIFGEGELRDTLQRKIEELGLSHRVILRGTCNDVHKHLYDAKLFVLSSDYEGIPNTLLEAMALGVPCVATDCRPGGAREIIDNGVNGMIVPCNNEEMLADAISLMLNNSKSEEELAIQAEDISKKFDPEIIYSRWEEFFEEYSGNKDL